MIITGTIKQANQASAPSGQYNVRYQDIIITDQAGNDWPGRIGSKQGYQVNTPISVTVETKQGDSGPYSYFRKYNPQYPATQQHPQAGQPSPSASPQSTEAKEDVDWDAKDLRSARQTGLNDATQLICLLAEMTKNTTTLNSNSIKFVAAEFVDYIYNGLKKKGNQPTPASEFEEKYKLNDDGSPQATEGEVPF